jgi:acyl-CoA synthetase (AMP-forming)/AMP-acid ligase II
VRLRDDSGLIRPCAGAARPTVAATPDTASTGFPSPEAPPAWRWRGRPARGTRVGVYVCGRVKGMIVLAGKNLYPNDIERPAASVDVVRKGCVIALRVRGDAQREGFAVLAEAHGADDAGARSRLVRKIVASVNSHIGHSPHDVLLFPAGTLPKTPSGKLRRTVARQLLTEASA